MYFWQVAACFSLRKDWNIGISATSNYFESGALSILLLLIKKGLKTLEISLKRFFLLRQFVYAYEQMVKHSTNAKLILGAHGFQHDSTL